MKTENRNVEHYEAPEMTQINIVPEGVLCQSSGEGEDGFNGGTFPEGN